MSILFHAEDWSHNGPYTPIIRFRAWEKNYLSLTDQTYRRDIDQACLEHFGVCNLVFFILDLEPRSRLKWLTTQLIHKFWKHLLPIYINYKLRLNNFHGIISIEHVLSILEFVILYFSYLVLNLDLDSNDLQLNQYISFGNTYCQFTSITNWD